MKKLFTLKLRLAGDFISSYFHANGQCQTGDCENGYGLYTMSWGDKYHGGWKDGVMHGRGKYYFNNGDTYGHFLKMG